MLFTIPNNFHGGQKQFGSMQLKAIHQKLFKLLSSDSTVEALALAFDCLEEGKSVEPSVRKELEAMLEEGLEAL